VANLLWENGMTRTPRLLVYWAGGLERAGGIGRVLGNLLDASRAAERPYVMKIMDTRGPYSIYVSPLFFSVALARTVIAALAPGRVAAHVNMAHKGSTVRKVIVCRLLAALRIRYVLHLHANNYDTYFEARPGWAKTLIRRAFFDADRIVVLGTLWDKVVVDDIGADPRKVLIIRNGVPDPGVPGPLPQPDCPMILFLGELQAWKGLGELIQALASERLRDLPWKLIVGGRGLEATYRAAAETAGIADRVSFKGWLPRDAVQKLLREASMVALPSYVEGLSVTLVEGLSHGVPVVATAVGAHPDILRDRENAVVVKTHDVESLAEGIRTLLVDRSLAENVGRGGRKLFEECLEIGGIETRFHDIYQELLGNAAGRRDAFDRTKNPSESLADPVA
jgi:glycosyltransferase involved in cell wall biosynthesis